MEIGRVQKLLLDALSSEEEAVQRLNYTLYNITELYTEFAERYNLWECKLTILNCSHHNDPLLIELIWTQIINIELDLPGSPEVKATRLMSKVKTLAKVYGNSGPCFPVPFLVRELELRCCRLKIANPLVPPSLIEINLDVDMLLDIYSSMISMSERIWAAEGNECHLVESTVTLLVIIATQPNLIATRNRRRVVCKAQELTSACRTFLYPKPDTKHLIDALTEIEAKLQRI